MLASPPAHARPTPTLALIGRPAASVAAASTARGRVLLAYRTPEVVADMAFHLARAGYAIGTAGSGNEVLDSSRLDPPALLLLGMSLPGLSGLTVLRRLRAHATTQVLPVIVLGRQVNEAAAVRAFQSGADDYVAVEPLRARELVSRVGAVLRRVRARAVPSDRIIEFGPLRLEFASRRASIGQREINLTPAETSLLFALCDGTLLESGSSRERRRRTKVSVQRLRVKLGPAGDMIETVRGAGYRLRTPRATTD